MTAPCLNNCGKATHGAFCSKECRKAYNDKLVKEGAGK